MSIQVVSNNAEADAKVNQPTEAGKSDAKSDATPSAPVEKAEQKESADSEAPETEAKEESEPAADAEGAVDDVDGGEEAEAKGDEDADTKPKKKSGFQRRIDKLNARITAERSRAELLESLLAKQNAAAPKQDATKSDPAKPATGDGKPKAEAFETHAEYVEALTDWKVDQREKARDQKLEQSKLQTEQAKLATTYLERAKAFAAKHSDYQEVLQDVDDIQAPRALQEIIMSSENGPELAYELAKNREEFARVCKLSPRDVAFEMGKIASRLQASGEKKPETKRVSSAPAPIAPVGGIGKGPTAKSIYDRGLSQSEYERARKEQMKQRRQA